MKSHIYSDYYAHLDFAQRNGPVAALQNLIQKGNAILEFYNNVDRDKMADYFADTAVRLANIGVSFSDDPSLLAPSDRNSTMYSVQYCFAKTYPLSVVESEFAEKYKKLFYAIWYRTIKQTMASRTFENWPDNPAEGGEFTTVPTCGVSVNDKIYLYYVAVKSWAPFYVHFTGMAFSDDDGKTFTRKSDYEASGTISCNADIDRKTEVLFSNDFIVNSIVKNVPDANDTHLYLFGIPDGSPELGNVKLARVDPANIEDKDAYEFCQINSGNCTWGPNESQATGLLDRAYVWLSVQWNQYLERWIMTHALDSTLVQIREAQHLYGPWSGAQVLWDCNGGGANPFCYAPFMHPAYFEGNGQTIYFTLSKLKLDMSVYDVFWHKAVIEKADPLINYPPNKPKTPIPVTGAIGQPRRIVVQWDGNDPNADALTYDVYAGIQQGNLIKIASDLSTESYSYPTTLNPSTKYYWKLVAKDSEYQTSGNIWNFTTGVQ